MVEDDEAIDASGGSAKTRIGPINWNRSGTVRHTKPRRPVVAAQRSYRSHSPWLPSRSRASSSVVSGN